MRENDPRFRRSRRLMREALVELARRGPENLTVSAICQATGVDRATFYRHFPDLEHLVADTLGHLADQAATRWEASADDVRYGHGTALPALLAYFEHIDENRALYGWALGGTGSAAALHGILDRTRRSIEDELLIAHHQESQTDLHRRATFAAGAVLGTILGWLADPHPAPAQEMAAWTVAEIENRLVYPVSAEAAQARATGSV